MITPAALLALAIKCAPTVHPDTLNDIAKIESGFHPWAIAEIIPVRGGDSRVVSYHPASREAALKILEEIKARKHRYSVGMMQITSSNFSGFGVDGKAMLDPCKNLSVAEKIITDCYLRGGSLKRALSCYYSGSFTSGQRPEKTFSNTSYIQRIGYVVPSTKEERQTLSPSSPDSAPRPVIYPDSVIRGALPPETKNPTPNLHYPPQIVRGGLVASVD
jgi:type IV secretion system protein VirB1